MGFSTHRVAAVDYAPRYPGVDVIFPLINVTGVGIPDGTRDEMAAGHCIGRTSADIGIYAMKPLGGGHLDCRSPEQAFDYLRGLGTIDTICVGVQSEDGAGRGSSPGGRGRSPGRGGLGARRGGSPAA